MEKLWAGRAHGALDAAADSFNSSISVDSRMYKEDIRGSIAHAAMLAKCGIISPDEGSRLIEGLGGILADLESGALAIDPSAEDIHSFVESELTARLGDVGKKLHTARSRNDQVAVDTRLYLRGEAERTVLLLKELIRAIASTAGRTQDAIMPGYTHLQRAQPVTFAHYILAYGMMFARDIGRIEDAAKRMNVSPLGCCALAGTTHPIDRAMTASELGFDGYCLNSLDGVSDRDFCVELASALALVMTHLSRLSEELVLFSSWEFGFVTITDAYTTGSSIMPQKKNADMCELIRGKAGRVCGDLITLLTMLKGLPLAYNKDMQEDKEAVFDAFDTVKACLGLAAPIISTLEVNRDKMLAAAKGGYINATDLADYLAKKGVPFRTAYKLTGRLVADCAERGAALEDLALEEFRAYSPVFEADLYDAISLEKCVERRTSAGGASPANIAAQLDYLRGITG
ncbi:MAG TPA: argininosuccinate lyase [Candidatus Scatomorpha intestinavium]|uniref:Argininosuccinate lyase n=1 Tax=Candidatus Scatomorpha intestinavium TaxID=2840922 RepID=A0A9D0ZCN8_9FIRM|nr:argininosuccinate lyase [Candidatus Scatomorpha intestinavium]